MTHVSIKVNENLSNINKDGGLAVEGKRLFKLKAKSVESSDDQDRRFFDKNCGDSECDEYLVEEFSSSLSETSLCRFTIEVTDIEYKESRTDSSMDASHSCRCQARREQMEEVAKKLEAFNSVQKQEAAQKICYLQNKLTGIADELNDAYEILLDGPVEATYAVPNNNAIDVSVECTMFPVSYTSRAVHLEHYIHYQITKYIDDMKKENADHLSVANQTDSKKKGDIEIPETLNSQLLYAVRSNQKFGEKMEVSEPVVQQMKDRTEHACSALDIKESVCSVMQKITQTSQCMQQPAEITEPSDQTHYLIKITPELENYIKLQLEQYLKSMNDLKKSESPPEENNKQNAPLGMQDKILLNINDNTSYNSYKQNIDFIEKDGANVKNYSSGYQCTKDKAIPCQNQNRSENQYHFCACFDVNNQSKKQNTCVGGSCVNCDYSGDGLGNVSRETNPKKRTASKDKNDCESDKNSNQLDIKEDSTKSDPSINRNEVPPRAIARRNILKPKKKSFLCGSCCSCRPSISSASEETRSNYQLPSEKPSLIPEAEITVLNKSEATTQTSWSNMLLIPKLQEDGHYELHIPPLDMVKYPTVGIEQKENYTDSWKHCPT